ncbi:MAG: M13 family metallopeptidase [Acidobacteriota bacterium]|nr:M13 family metallopeptidase [Acidobacteriota bacterium]
MLGRAGLPAVVVACLMSRGAAGQAPTPDRGTDTAAAASATKQAAAERVERPLPGLDTTSMDLGADPCTDMYRYACGRFAENHPIPADQPAVDPFYVLANVNTQQLNAILEKAAAGGAQRQPDEQKIGDYYTACLNTEAIEAKGMGPVKPLLDEIDGLGSSQFGKLRLAGLTGRLQRQGVDVFFAYGEQQDLKDATKQIATAGQGGLGLPEKDYYLRTGKKDEALRDKYVAHVAKMLVLAGSSAGQAERDARRVLALETALAKASLGVVDLRDPEKTYHLQTIAQFEASLPGVNFGAFREGIHSPAVSEINNSTPGYWPVLVAEVKAADMATLRAYLKYHLLTAVAGRLPKRFDEENFDFYGRTLSGQPEQRARWKRCSTAVTAVLGDALGKVYVAQYFAGDSKEQMLAMVHDIEGAMRRDIEASEWMSASSKARAQEKLRAVANKIGYPDTWRDYAKLEVAPDDALGNLLRANAFENDRQLAKIGKPLDRTEWELPAPEVNAYYNASLNEINFPAGILQSPFFDRTQDVAVNYGHIGAVIGHELTHGFDDEGRRFDGKGNLSDWWTAEDAKKFEARTDCLVNEYGAMVAIDDVKVNGKLTLGENTADNGGLLLAYMAYLQRASDDHLDTEAKREGLTGPQRFFTAYAQNYCQSTRPEAVRAQVLEDPHAPDQLRVNGVIVNQPGFAAAFGCKKPTPMVPENSCRVW